MTPRAVSRLKLVGIGLLALLPVLASYVLYWTWEPDEYTNYGELLDPHPVPAAELKTVDGQPFDFAQLRGHWVLVTVDGGACPPACEEKLWLMRQVRKAQGKDFTRVERVWLIDDGEVPPPRLAQDYAGTWFVGVRSARQALAAFPAERSIRDHIYLLDPRGNVMMRFPHQPEPKRIVRDLSRLLRYSRTG